MSTPSENYEPYDDAPEGAGSSNGKQPNAGDPYPPDGQPYGTQPFETQQPFGTQSPYGTQPFGGQPYESGPYGSQPYGTAPFEQQPFDSPSFGAQPFAAQPFGAQHYGAQPYGMQPYGAPGYGAMQPYAPSYGAVRKEPALSLVLSFFLPGLGTLINGQTGKGVGIMAGYFLGMVLSIVLIGIPIMLGFWVWGMVDGYSGAKNHNLRNGFH